MSTSHNERHIILAVTGMHCAACANTIQKSVRTLEGIKDINVNFASEKASVTFDDAQVNEQQIIGQIKKAGYNAEIAKANDSEGDKKRHEHQIKNIKRNFGSGSR